MEIPCACMFTCLALLTCTHCCSNNTPQQKLTHTLPPLCPLQHVLFCQKSICRTCHFLLPTPPVDRTFIYFNIQVFSDQIDRFCFPSSLSRLIIFPTLCHHFSHSLYILGSIFSPADLTLLIPHLFHSLYHNHQFNTSSCVLSSSLR